MYYTVVTLQLSVYEYVPFVCRLHLCAFFTSLYCTIYFSLLFFFLTVNRKVRFDEDRKRPSGILDDDNWLDPERREEEYKQLVNTCLSDLVSLGRKNWFVSCNNLKNWRVDRFFFTFFHTFCQTLQAFSV